MKRLETRYNGENLEVKFEGTDWQDFIPEDKRAWSKEDYEELIKIVEWVQWYHYHKPEEITPIM